MKNPASDNRTLREPVAFDGAPDVFLPYQQAWAADTSDVKVIEKSRRIGLSWAEAGEDALLAAAASGMDVFYIGYNESMTREFIEDCGAWARFYNLAAGEIEDFIWPGEKAEERGIRAFRIVFPSGYKVIALSSKPSNLRGKQGKIVIDEAAFHDDLPGLLKAAMAMLMWGGRVVVISTHNGDDHPFNELVNDVRSGKKPYSLHRVTIDEALSQGLYKRICLRLSRPWSQAAENDWRARLFEFYGDDADEELLCIPSRGSGVYFPRALVERCMDAALPVVRWACKAGFETLDEETRAAAANDFCEEKLAPLLDAMAESVWPTYFGEDFGRSGDLTVIWQLMEDGGLAHKTPFVCELRNVPFRQQEQILFYIVDRLPNFRGGALDSRGNGQYLAEVAMQRYGEHLIDQVMLTTEWYREHMPKYKAAYEDAMITIPKDGDLLDDHRAIRMQKGIARAPETGRKKGRDGGQRHADAAIAGALALYAVNTIEADTWDDDYDGQTAAAAEFEDSL